MLKTSITLAAAVALTACASSRPAEPQPELTGSRTVERIQPPPVHALLGYRTELDLTSEQIESLDSIGQWLFTSGDTIRTRLRELQGTSRGRRDPEAAQEALVAITGLTERNRQASEGVQEVLSDEQEARVCELFREDRQRAASRVRQARARRPGESPEGGAPPVWNWCGRPPADADTADNGN